MLKHLAFCAGVLLAVAICSSAESDPQRVWANYDKTKPPGGNQSTIVKIGFHIMSLDLDDVTKEMRASMYFRQSWNDTRLSDLGSNNVRLMDIDRIWLPDTFIRYDRNDQLAPGKVSNNYRLLKVSSGKVWYVIKLVGAFTCKLGMRRYPKDAPVCEMNIESFGYTADVMDLKFMDRAIDFDTAVMVSTGIYLVDTEANDCSVNYSTGTYPCLSFKLHFRRAVPAQFIPIIYLPSTIIVLLSTSAFWIQPDNPTARLLVGVLTTLTMTLHAAAVRLYYVSSVTYLTLLDAWLISCVLIVFIAFVLQLAGVVIAGLKAKKQQEQATKVEAAAAENNECQQLIGTRTDIVGKIAIPVLFVLLIIIYAAV